MNQCSRILFRDALGSGLCRCTMSQVDSSKAGRSVVGKQRGLVFRTYVAMNEKDAALHLESEKS